MKRALRTSKRFLNRHQIRWPNRAQAGYERDAARRTPYKADAGWERTCRDQLERWAGIRFAGEIHPGDHQRRGCF
jgi:hypothetical protein